MNKTQEALRVEQALKLALAWVADTAKYIPTTYDRKGMALYAILKEALAKQCVCGEPDTPGTHRTDGPCLAEQPAQQEPVAGVVIREGLPTLLQDRHIKPTDQRLYTSPPNVPTARASKPWVGLEPQDFKGIDMSDAFEAGAYWANNILREKNE